MNKQLKQLGKDTLIYGLGESLNRSIGFLLIPLYTRYLVPADYGNLEILSVTQAILFVVVSQGLGTAFFRFYCFATTEEEKRGVFTTSFLYLVMSSVVSLGALCLAAEPVSVLLFETGALAPVLRLALIESCAQLLGFIPYQLLRARLQSFKYITISSVAVILRGGLNIYFVAGLELGLTGIVLGNLAGTAAIAVSTLVIARGQFAATFSPGATRAMVKFGVPLIFTSVSLWALQISDRFLLQRLASPHDLGLYSLACRFASILSLLLIGPFHTAWGPYCFEIAKKPDAQETFRQISTYFLLLMAALGVVVIVWAPVALRLVASPEFWDARHAIIYLVYALVIYGMLIVVTVGVYITGATQHLSYVLTIAAAISVGANLLLIPRLGMVGAGVSACIAYGVGTAMAFVVSQRVYAIPFDRVRMLKIGVVFVGVTMLGHHVECEGRAWDLAFRAALLPLFAAGVYALRAVPREIVARLWCCVLDVWRAKGLAGKIQVVVGQLRP